MLLARQSKQDVALDHVKDGKLASSKAVAHVAMLTLGEQVLEKLRVDCSVRLRRLEM